MTGTPTATSSSGAPTRVILVNELPRTISGKIQKNLLGETLRREATGSSPTQVYPGRGSSYRHASPFSEAPSQLAP